MDSNYLLNQILCKPTYTSNLFQNSEVVTQEHDEDPFHREEVVRRRVVQLLGQVNPGGTEAR